MQTISFAARSYNKASLDLESLYAGEVVSFQIEDKQWLVDNNVIPKRKKNRKIYVKNFEIFLPTVTKGTVHYTTEYSATGKLNSSSSTFMGNEYSRQKSGDSKSYLVE